MLKEEFESLIGKEVTADTFKMYESMYMACPEWVDKQTFVGLINVDAIEESQEAVARREERARRIAKIDNDICCNLANIGKYNQYIKGYKDLLTHYPCCEENEKYYKQEIKRTRKWIRDCKNKIKELKFLKSFDC